MKTLSRLCKISGLLRLLALLVCQVSLGVSAQTQKTYNGDWDLSYPLNTNGKATYTYYEDPKTYERVKNGPFTLTYIGTGTSKGFDFKVKGNYMNNLKNGIWSQNITLTDLKGLSNEGYYASGTIILTSTYKNGNPDGIWKFISNIKGRKLLFNANTRTYYFGTYIKPETEELTVNFQNGFAIGKVHYVKRVEETKYSLEIEYNVDSLGFIDGRCIHKETGEEIITEYIHGLEVKKLERNLQTGSVNIISDHSDQLDQWINLLELIKIDPESFKNQCILTIGYYDAADIVSIIDEKMFGNIWNYGDIPGNILYDDDKEYEYYYEKIMDHEYWRHTQSFLTKKLEVLPPKTAEDYSKEAVERGNIKFSAKDYTGAIVEYDNAIELDPKSFQAYFKRAEAKKYLNDFGGAISDYDKAIEYNTKEKSPDLFFNRASAKQNLLDFQGAIVDWNTAIDQGLNAESEAKAFYYRGWAKQAIKDYIGANEDYNRAIDLRISGFGLDPYINRGTVRMKLKDYQNAIKDYDIALNYDLKDLKNKVLFNRGFAKNEIKEYSNAIKDFNIVIENGEKELIADALYYRGYAKQALNDIPGAIADYKRDIELNPTDAQAFSNLGSIYLQQLKNDDAIQMFTKAILIDEDEIDYDNLGWAYVGKEDYQSAINAFQKCLTINDKNLDALIGYAFSAFNKKDKITAKTYIDRVIVIMPSLSNGIIGIKELESQGYFYSENQKEMILKMLKKLQ